MNHMICPNAKCGYEGVSLKKRRASRLLGVLLLFLWVLPGVLYFVMRNGFRHLCPRCGLQISSDG